MSQEPSAPYRPVSGLAVAGFALALLFTVGMLTATAVAFYSRLPLQIDFVWLLVPLAAVCLSVAGLVQVRKSEGTRVGAGLARWGLGLSAAMGLGYLAYSAATEEALRQQASAFADRWFELLQERRTDAAFWDTLEPGQRDLTPALSPRFLKEQPQIAERLEALVRDQGRLALDRPELLALVDEFPALSNELAGYFERRYFWGGVGRPGRLAVFHTDGLVQLVERWRERAQIEPQGIRSWSYTGTGTQGRYQVVLGYRIRTPEGHVDALVTLFGSQLPGDPGRHWQVLMPESGLRTNLVPTEVGKLALALSDSSRQLAEEWLQGFAAQRRVESYLGMLPPEERQRQECLYAAQAALPYLAGVMPLVQGETARRLFLPDFASFAEGKRLDSRDLKADGTIRPAIVQYSRALFAERPPAHADFPRLLDPPDLRIPVPWRIDGPLVIFEHPFLARIPPRFIAEGTIEVASTNPQLIAGLEGKGGPPPPDPGWWIGGLKLRVAGVTKKGSE